MVLFCSSVTLLAATEKCHIGINFDKSERMKYENSSAIIDPQSGITFLATVDKGTIARHKPSIVAEHCRSIPRCLRISLDPSRRGAEKNKIMYSFWSHYRDLPGGNNGRIRVGDGRFTKVSFSMKLGPEYSTPLNQMIHFQIYQPHRKITPSFGRTVVPGGPIVSLRIVPVSRRRNKSPDIEEFVLAVRSPQAGRLIHFDARDEGVLYRGELIKGSWNSFALVLKSLPSSGGVGGRIGFWLNGHKRFDRSVPWGFNPSIFPSSSNLGVELGSYRSADAKGHQTVYFDDVTIDR